MTTGLNFHKVYSLIDKSIYTWKTLWKITGEKKMCKAFGAGKTEENFLL